MASDGPNTFKAKTLILRNREGTESSGCMTYKSNPAFSSSTNSILARIWSSPENELSDSDMVTRDQMIFIDDNWAKKYRHLCKRMGAEAESITPRPKSP